MPSREAMKWARALCGHLSDPLQSQECIKHRAEIIDSAADEKYKPLVEAADRTLSFIDAGRLPTSGDLRQALGQVKGESK